MRGRGRGSWRVLVGVVWAGLLMGQVTSIPPASGSGGGGGGSLPSQTLYPSSLLTTDGTTAAWTYTTKIPSSGTQSLGAANAISADRSYVTISPTSTFTFSATPTIADGTDGQVVTITNVGASYIATLPGEAAVTGSNICSTSTLSPGASVKLVFSTALSCWSAVGGVSGGTITNTVMTTGGFCGTSTVLAGGFSIPAANATGTADSVDPVSLTVANNTPWCIGLVNFVVNTTAKETLYYRFALPSNWDEGSITLTLNWFNTTAVNGQITKWEAAIGCLNPGSAMTTGPTFPAAASNTLAEYTFGASDSTDYLETDFGAVAQGSGCVAGSIAVFRIQRNSMTSNGDTNANAASLTSIRFSYGVI